MKERIKVSGVPANETFFQKAKRKARTAVNWGKTHWKGIAIGALALGGGAYMLSRRGNGGGDEPECEYHPDGETFREAIERTFEHDGSDVGPQDDEPDDVIDE